MLTILSLAAEVAETEWGPYSRDRELLPYVKHFEMYVWPSYGTAKRVGLWSAARVSRVVTVLA